MSDLDSDTSNRSKRSKRSNTVYIYNGGSFSCPTLAHQEIVIGTIKFLLKYYLHSPIDTIEYTIAPVSDMYPKPSVKPACISFEARFDMLSMMVRNIVSEMASYDSFEYSDGIIHCMYKGKRYKIQIILTRLEQEISHQRGRYVGTYEYLLEFQKDKDPDNIYLSFGGDNMYSLLSPIKRWKNPIHLFLNFKFMAYSREGFELDYGKMAQDLIQCIGEFDETNPTHIETDYLYNSNGLEDIRDKIKLFDLDPIRCVGEHVIKIDINSDTKTDKQDVLALAEMSSSKARQALYEDLNYLLKPSEIEQFLGCLAPNIREFILSNGLYRSGEICEGAENFAKIKSELERRVNE
jgi:nicotinic acid mononucleotide adenylyltransferase